MTPINRIQLAQALTRADIILQGPTLSERYRRVTRTWFYHQFGPALIQALAQFGLARNRGQEGWDCTELCLFGVTYARLLNALQDPSAAPAVGMIGYGGIGGVPGHAVLAAVVEGHGVACWDPTVQRPVTLTEEEKSLCRITLF